jgi:hypothetical protein
VRRLKRTAGWKGVSVALFVPSPKERFEPTAPWIVVAVSLLRKELRLRSSPPAPFQVPRRKEIGLDPAAGAVRPWSERWFRE